MSQPPVGPESEERPPPLPTRIRFERTSPARQRTDLSLMIFIGLLLLISVAGWQGFALIGKFLTVAGQRRDAPRPDPTAEPVPGAVPVMIEDRPAQR